MSVNARLVIRDADTDGAGFLDSFYGESMILEATARAANNAALSVHGSVVSVADRVKLGWWFDGNTTFTADRPLNELQQRKAAFTHLHTYLNTLAVNLAAEGVAHPVAEVHAAHNFPAFGHHGAYRVAHDADLTHTEKVAWAVNMLGGPSDATLVFEWYQRISLLDPVVGPSGPCGWYNPETGVQLTVEQTRDQGTDIFGSAAVSDIQLSDGAWIEELT